jgi:hypothetical protein
VVRAADGALEFGNKGLGLVTREPLLANPIEIDFGFAGFDVGAGSGASGTGNAAILAVVAVVEQSGEAQDQSVEIEGLKVPLVCLCDADAIVDGGEG